MGNKSISFAEIKSLLDCIGDISAQTKNNIVVFRKENIFLEKCTTTRCH